MQSKTSKIVETRYEDLKELEQFIKSTEKRINNILESISWKHEGTRTTRPSNEQNVDDLITSWCRRTSTKVREYEEFLEKHKICTDLEFTALIAQSNVNVSNEETMSFAEITKLKRDLKRRRMKHRTSKAPPLSYSEELRGLIGLQMESWQQYIQDRN